MVETIVKKVRGYNMGYSLNIIQDIAEQVLSQKRWRQYLIASCRDSDECDGMDGILLNREYFDWREFGYNKDNIVRAYLRYFNDNEVTRIANML